MNHFGVDVESLVRVLGAIGLGAIVGFEREANDQAAGLRTHISVALGACVFGIVSTLGFGAFEATARNLTTADGLDVKEIHTEKRNGQLALRVAAETGPRADWPDLLAAIASPDDVVDLQPLVQRELVAD